MLSSGHLFSPSSFTSNPSSARNVAPRRPSEVTPLPLMRPSIDSTVTTTTSSSYHPQSWTNPTRTHHTQSSNVQSNRISQPRHSKNRWESDLAELQESQRGSTPGWVVSHLDQHPDAHSPSSPITPGERYDGRSLTPAAQIANHYRSRATPKFELASRPRRERTGTKLKTTIKTKREDVPETQFERDAPPIVFLWLFMSEPQIPFAAERVNLMNIPDIVFDMKTSARKVRVGDGISVVADHHRRLEGGSEYVFTMFGCDKVIVHLWWPAYPFWRFPIEVPTRNHYGVPIDREEVSQVVSQHIRNMFETIVRDKYASPHEDWKFVRHGRGVRLEEIRLLSLKHIGGRHFRPNFARFHSS